MRMGANSQVMAMHKTIQNGYVPIRLRDVAEDEPELDGVTDGLTFDEHDRPVEAKSFGEDGNAMFMYFTGTDSTANADVFSAKIYTYATSGPAEFVADISGTAGTARINDSASDLFIDTINISSQDYFKNVSVIDSGNNRIAKLAFDFVGNKYLYIEFYDVSNGHNAWARTF